MRQLLNVSYAVQAEAITDESELQRWLLELERDPDGTLPTRGLSRIDPGLLDMLGPRGA